MITLKHDTLSFTSPETARQVRSLVERLPADEGATVQALEQSGEWTRIRGSDGREGWVLNVTLAP